MEGGGSLRGELEFRRRPNPLFRRRPNSEKKCEKEKAHQLPVRILFLANYIRILKKLLLRYTGLIFEYPKCLRSLITPPATLAFPWPEARVAEKTSGRLFSKCSNPGQGRETTILNQYQRYIQVYIHIYIYIYIYITALDSRWSRQKYQSIAKLSM